MAMTPEPISNDRLSRRYLHSVRACRSAISNTPCEETGSRRSVPLQMSRSPSGEAAFSV